MDSSHGPDKTEAPGALQVIGPPVLLFALPHTALSPFKSYPVRVSFLSCVEHTGSKYLRGITHQLWFAVKLAGVWGK